MQRSIALDPYMISFFDELFLKVPFPGPCEVKYGLKSITTLTYGSRSKHSLDGKVLLRSNVVQYIITPRRPCKPPKFEKMAGVI